MISIIQRVKNASVKSENKNEEISSGLLIFVGVSKEDSMDDAISLAEKTVNLRIFSDANGKMNLSLIDTKGEALVISQFTLLANCKKGRRPSFENAADPKTGMALYNAYANIISENNGSVKTGEFGADMQIELVNDGPVTIILDSNAL